jgi:hypothetical protein
MMILLIAIIISLICVVATHKVIAMMAGDSLSKLYSHYSFNKISFSYLLYMSTILFAVYFFLVGFAYNAWIQ